MGKFYWFLKSSPFLLYKTYFKLTLDIDECETNVDNCDQVNGNCSNTEGSFECTCNVGYTGDGIDCEGKSNVYSYVVCSTILCFISIIS